MGWNKWMLCLITGSLLVIALMPPQSGVLGQDEPEPEPEDEPEPEGEPESEPEGEPEDEPEPEEGEGEPEEGTGEGDSKYIFVSVFLC